MKKVDKFELAVLELKGELERERLKDVAKGKLPSALSLLPPLKKPKQRMPKEVVVEKKRRQPTEVERLEYIKRQMKKER